MRPHSELVDDDEPAWPLVEQWIGEAVVDVEVLPADPEAAMTALHGTQVTTRSPMGAIVYRTAGLLVDSGWLRVLGAGGHPRLRRSLPAWNDGRADGFYLIADDVAGGSFALNGGAFGEDRGNIYYYAPDSLRWEPCQLGYSQFLVWAMSARLADFYESLRWDGWRSEVGRLTGDQSINFFPPLFADGTPRKDRSRRAVPVAEQFALQLDLQRQLDGR